MRSWLLAAALILWGTPRGFALSARDFTVFSLGDLDYCHSDFEGRSGAAGDFRFSKFALGAGLPSGATAVAAGGSVRLADGTVNGSIRAGGGARLARVDASAPVWTHADVSALGEVSAELLGASDRLSALAPTDAPTQVDGGLTLAGAPGAALSVVEVDASALESFSKIVVGGPEGGVLVVNVRGAAVRLVNAEIDRVGRGAVVFNFPRAASLTLSGVGLRGIVLAPRAKTAFSSGRIEGHLYVGSLVCAAVGDGQVNLSPDRWPPLLGGASGRK